MAVYKSGKAWVDNLIVIRALPNGCEYSRYGFSVTKNIGKAVVRNHIKRLLKEISRNISVKSGWDIVIIARPEAVNANYGQLVKSMETLLFRAKLINKDEAVRAGAN